MNIQDLFSRRWPRQGIEEELINRALKEMLGQNKEWGRDIILGFPSMSPHPKGIEVFNVFQAKHTNAILTHTRGGGEKGFDGVKAIEKNLIISVANLLGLRDGNVDGYVTPGGTEANIMGMWIGREKLRAEYGDPSDRRVIVLTSPASHYSVRKACFVTDLGRGEWTKSEFIDPMSEENVRLKSHFIPALDGSGLHYVRCNISGQIDVEDLERKIRILNKQHGISRFIIFLNEGTTLTGAMDNTPEVGRLITSLRQEFNNEIGFYLHIDAAYGGFIYPFLDPNGIWAFRVPEVDSLTTDPYKMGQCPMAEGLFICKKHLQKYIEQDTGYVNDEKDDTLCGSRSGAYAVACWTVMKTEGFEGYARMHKDSVDNAQLFHSLLSQIIGITIIPQYLNMVAFILPEGLDAGDYKTLEDGLIKKYTVMWDWLITDPENPESKPLRVVKCNITRDVKTEWINAFAAKLRSILSKDSIVDE